MPDRIDPQLKKQVIEELPNPFKNSHAVKLAKKHNLKANTIVIWGSKSGKTFTYSHKGKRAKQEHEAPAVTTTDPTYLQIGDLVTVVKSADDRYRNQMGNFIRYDKASRLYTVEMPDGVRCTTTAVHKYTKVTKPKRAPKISRPEMRFIHDFYRESDMTYSEMSLHSGLPTSTINSAISRVRRKPQLYPSLFDWQAKAISNKFNLHFEIATIEKALSSKVMAGDQTAVLTESLSQTYRLTDGNLIVEAVINASGRITAHLIEQDTKQIILDTTKPHNSQSLANIFNQIYALYGRNKPQ